MITLVHIDSLGGINYHRLITPLMRLQQHGINLHWIGNLNEIKEMNLDMVDNLIISRKASINNHSEFSRMLKKHKVKLILDNDDFWELGNANPAKGLYDVYYGPDIKKTIKIADVIWTPSEYLAKQMRQVNPNATYEIINNALNVEEEQWANQTKYPSDLVRFGYVGAMGHDYDIASMGYDFSEKELYCAQISDYPDVLKAKYVMSPRKIHNYGEMYRSFDVSLAPLEGNRFNWSKSDLKVTEAALTKTAIIASNTRPYNKYVIHGETGLLCRNKKEWREAIEAMTPELARSMGQKLHDSLKDSPDHNLDLLNQKRLKYLL
jgi:glycosyltransferase involved in cell wall biosynthesis